MRNPARAGRDPSWEHLLPGACDDVERCLAEAVPLARAGGRSVSSAVAVVLVASSRRQPWRKHLSSAERGGRSERQPGTVSVMVLTNFPRTIALTLLKVAVFCGVRRGMPPTVTKAASQWLTLTGIIGGRAPLQPC